MRPMIRSLLMAGVLVSACLMLTGCPPPCWYEVIIPDPGLERAIRDNLGLSDTDPITAIRLAAITFVDADDRGISDLTGLEYCTSLTELHLYYNQISDITPLQDLTSLTVLELGMNCIADLIPLLLLPDLYAVDVGYNPLSDSAINTQIPELEANGAWVVFRTWSDDHCTGESER